MCPAGFGTGAYPPRFAASKNALDAFSRCFAPEVAADGIHHHDPRAPGAVSAVSPGLHQLIMAGAFPDTAGRTRDVDAVSDEQPVTPEAYALGMLMRGIHL